MLRPRKFKELETKLGHRFKDSGLLEQALTHASVRGGKIARFDNERLEFIGDRVLGLAIAEILNQQYPEASEGELARRYNRLVRGEACAKVARNIGLGAHLILSESEADSGGRDKTTILADAAEALLGAVFIDGGFEKARVVVHKLWQEQSEPVPEVAVDAKSALQEWAQGQGLALPKIYGCVAQRPRPRAALYRRSDHRGEGARTGRGRIEAYCRAGRRNGTSDPRR